MTIKPCIVFDTNALISALMYPASVSAMALTEAVNHFQLVASDATWSELETVSARKKFAKYWTEHDRLIFLANLASMTDLHVTQSVIEACVDKTDNKFLELAVDTNTVVIVSGDAHLRTMHPFRHISIISPGEFLSFVRSPSA